MQIFAPLRLFVQINAQAAAPSARRFLTDRGMMYQDHPDVIHMLYLLLACA